MAPLEETLAAAGGVGRAASVDVRDVVALRHFLAGLPAEWAPRIVVPAAGIARVAPFAALSDEDWRESLDTNLLGAIHLYREALPGVLSGQGHLFAVLSIAARRGFENWSAYAASKWALRGVFECLREELRGTGVLLSAIYAGATASPLWDALDGEWDRSAMIEADEVARTVVWALESGGAVEEILIRPRGGDL